jgi:hypothetical protein
MSGGETCELDRYRESRRSMYTGLLVVEVERRPVGVPSVRGDAAEDGP